MNPAGTITVTDVCAVLNSTNGTNFAFTGKRNDPVDHLFVAEFDGSTFRFSQTNLTNTSTTASIGGTIFPSNIIEIDATTNGGYFISGMNGQPGLYEGMFYYRVKYGLPNPVADQSIYSLKSFANQGGKYNAQNAQYDPGRDEIYISGSVNDDAYLGLFFDKIKNVSTNFPIANGALSNTWGPSPPWTGTTGFPIYNFIGGPDQPFNAGFVYSEAIFDCTWKGGLKAVGFRSMETNNANNTVNLPGLLEVSYYENPGVGPFNYNDWPTLSNSFGNLNFFYPRLNGNDLDSPFDTYDADKEYNKPYYRYHQFVKHEYILPDDHYISVGQPGRDPGVNSETAVLFNVNGFENQCGTTPFTPLAENLQMTFVPITIGTATQINNSNPGGLTLQTPTIYPNTPTNDCLTQNPFIPVTESAEDKENRLWFAEQSLFWSNADDLSSIVLYNTQGQIIRTIDKQELRMGQYVFGELPSGLYITIANYVDNKSTQLKIIL